MSDVGADERLRVAFERYRRAMAAHRPTDPEIPLRVAAARIDLTLRLVEAGERLPEPVAEQLQQDTQQLLAETDPLRV